MLQCWCRLVVYKSDNITPLRQPASGFPLSLEENAVPSLAFKTPPGLVPDHLSNFLPRHSALYSIYKHTHILSVPGKSHTCSHLRALAPDVPSVSNLLPLLKSSLFSSFRFRFKHHLLREAFPLLPPQITFFLLICFISFREFMTL